MKIAMIGSGAAGSVFAAYLKRGGAEMYLVDRYKAHMQKISEEGLCFVSPSGEERLYGFHTSETAEGLCVMDAVILMVKATQTESVMPSLGSCIGEKTLLVSLQNGLDNELVLQKFVPPERILYGFGTIGTELPEPAKCVAKPESGVIMRFGALKPDAHTQEMGKRLEAIFNAGGCETRFEADIRPFVWKKAISNSGYNTLSALTGLSVGTLLDSDTGRSLLLSVWEEAAAVAEAVCGVDLRAELAEELPRLQEGFKSYYPSMAQDMLQFKRQTEIELLNGAIVRYGRQYGIKTPVNEALTRMVSCVQANYDSVFKS